MKNEFFQSLNCTFSYQEKKPKALSETKISGGAYPRTPWSCDCRKPRLRANTRFGVRIFILSDSQLFSEPETLYPTV